MMCDDCMHTIIVLAFNRKQTILALVVLSFYSRKIKFGNIILILESDHTHFIILNKCVVVLYMENLYLYTCFLLFFPQGLY